MIRAAIKEISVAFPENILTNEQLAQEFEGDWTADKIFEKTGIRTRHIALPGECASDLGVLAAEKLFLRDGCSREKVDYLLFCTQSPDFLLPSTAALLQERLGLSVECGALDINQGCSGYIYGLSLGKGLIESGIAHNVLLITAETYSKHINPKDRSVRTIFGDGAAATWLEGRESEKELIGPFYLCTDGRGAGNLIVSAGGMRNRFPEKVEGKGLESWRTPYDLFMDGPEIFNFTLESVPETYRKLLKKANLKQEDVDFFVFHQANRFILEHLRKSLGIKKEKFPYALEKYGNTVSSTIPIVLEQLLKNGAVGSGTKAMLLGFGVGYSWGGTIVEF